MKNVRFLFPLLVVFVLVSCENGSGDFPLIGATIDTTVVQNAFDSSTGYDIYINADVITDIASTSLANGTITYQWDSSTSGALSFSSYEDSNNGSSAVISLDWATYSVAGNNGIVTIDVDIYYNYENSTKKIGSATTAVRLIRP